MRFATSRTSTRALAVGAAALTALAATACSDESSADTETTEEQTREAQLSVLVSAAEMHPDANGGAVLTVADGTSVELEVSGLAPETAHTSHLHDATCESDPPGGDHWMADPDGEMTESNEIHLHFTTDADGNGSVAVDSDLVADDRVKSIVVHSDAMGEMEDGEHDHAASDRVLCGNFD